MPDDEYLGDGVYASYDGWQIWLDLRGQDANMRIALEPDVMSNLERYAKRCDQDFQELMDTEKEDASDGDKT